MEKGIYKLVENIGTVNRSELRTEAEKAALLAELTKSSGATAKADDSAQQSVPADRPMTGPTMR